MALDSTKIPTQRCWKCGYKMDRTTEAYSNAKPKPGDVSLCLNCGTLCIFTETFMLRKPTPEEKEKMEREPSVIEAQMARAYIVAGRKLKGQE